MKAKVILLPGFRAFMLHFVVNCEFLNVFCSRATHAFVWPH